MFFFFFFEMFLMLFKLKHRRTVFLSHLQHPAHVILRVAVKVQGDDIRQRVQRVAGSIFNPASDAGLQHSGLNRGLGLPDADVGAIPKRLDGVSCRSTGKALEEEHKRVIFLPRYDEGIFMV